VPHLPLPGRALAPACPIRSRPIERLATDPRLAGSHLVPATLAELHQRLGQHDRAEDHCRRALELASTAPERELLARRLADLAAAAGAPAAGRVGLRRPAT
jgi:predicted RNA polymerase sigma factor